MRPLALAFVALSLASAACQSPSPPGPAAVAAPPPATAEQATSAVATASPVAALPGASSEDLKALARGSNGFATDLYSRVRAQEKGNLVISPFSVHTALAMAWAGARGETAAQMKKALHLDGDRAIDVAGSLIKDYGAPENKVTVRIADRLFGDKSMAFAPPYLSRVRQAFGAPLEPVDFAGAAPAARGRINAWVARETEDRIKDLIPEGGVDASTRLVLTNAVYFLGDWAVPFKKEDTRPAPFFTGKTESKDVPTMHRHGEHRFGAIDGVKLVDLPYQNGALALTIVVPDAVDGLDALEQRLTPEALDRWLGAATTMTNVAISLPKLEISPARALSLAETLKDMGMALAFDGQKADFTGIAPAAAPGRGIFIGKVFHKAFIKVDEKGTEAAAASAVVMTIKGMPVRPHAEIKADHPFLYLLRDTRSGLVLFMGRVADPAAK